MKTAARKKNRIIKGPRFTLLAAGLVIIAFVLAMQPASAEARGYVGSSKSPDQVVERLKARLDLTDEQAEAIRPVITEKVQRMKDIRDRAGTDRQAARAEIRKLRWDTQKKLGEILTDEQVEKYLELKGDHRDRKHRDRHRAGKRLKDVNKTPEQAAARLTERLNLTEEQAAQIEPIIRESFEKRHEVFRKYSDQRLNTRQAMRSEMQAIGDETHARISKILTDEQRGKFPALEKERRERAHKRMRLP